MNIAGGFQFIVQTLFPLFTGIAVSSERMSVHSAECCFRLIRTTFVGFLLIYVVEVLPVTIRDISFSGGATMSQSAIILQSMSIVLLSGFEKGAFNLVLLMMALLVPAISATRGPMAASLALLVMHPAWQSVRVRMLMTCIAVAAGFLFFTSERVQKKTFVSGSGSVDELKWENPDVLLNGRQRMWDDLLQESHKRMKFGHGANADAKFLIAAGHPTWLAHNDWLRMYFNYGGVGVILFAITLVWQYVHALRFARIFGGLQAIFLLTGAGCFIPFAIDMFAENIIITGQYFGALQYLILGLGYAGCAHAAAHAQGEKITAL